MCKIFLAVILLAFGASLEGGAAMLVAARESFAIANAKRWTNPYSTDGLVRMWDGEWPAGVGGETAQTATSWVDLINGAEYGRGTHIRYDSGKKCFSTNKIGSSNAARFTFGAVDTLSIEVVAAGTYSTGNYRVFVAPQGYLFIGVGLSTLKITPLGSSRADFSVPLNRATYFANTATPVMNSNVAYINGVEVARGNKPPGTVNYIAAPSQSANNVSGNLYAVRVYSRVLSAAEIAAHYAVDHARFNLP